MSDWITVKLQRPHKTQQELLDSVKRFNHVRCGRRWGKTTLICELCKPALEGYPVGIWYPTYKDLSEVWKEVKKRYHPVIVKKDEVPVILVRVPGERFQEVGPSFAFAPEIVALDRPAVLRHEPAVGCISFRPPRCRWRTCTAARFSTAATCR